MRWKRIVKHILMAVLMPFFMNVPLLIQACTPGVTAGGGRSWLNIILVTCLCIGLFICWLTVNLIPYRDKNSPNLRLTVMRGGCTLCRYALYGLTAEVLLVLMVYPGVIKQPERYPLAIAAVNGVYALLIFFIILWNGILRMFLLSARLRLRTRILMLLAMWIPLLNLLVLLYAIGQVRAEYDFACYKESVRTVRAESDLCKTRYPLILVHGVGFRDRKYFNYWGRIPRELTRYGAVVYYGNQEAMGTITYNAGDIRKKIMEVIKETGCEKVNIIAHSKGGLDSRYAISKLGMDAYTASLTTICTPHYGCRFVDYVCRLPEGLYRLAAGSFDWVFRRFGDKNPDFYTATHQFSTAASRLFNAEVKDAAGVYYQSYASVMRRAVSDMLLWLPYCLIYPLEGANDGLVSSESARWGEFQTVFTSTKLRGISHGDMIDLKREDYKGFDVVECYVQIVSQLKEKGF